MADDNMALLETLRKTMAGGDVDILREGVRILAQAIMEAEVSEVTGLPHGERDPERRLTNRNGYRERRWDTRVGSVDLAIPRVRDGSYFPSLLEPRRRAERALLAVDGSARGDRRGLVRRAPDPDSESARRQHGEPRGAVGRPSLDAGSQLDVIGPVGGKTITFVESAVATNGGQATVEVQASPFLGEDHFHPKAEERLEVLEGEVSVRVGAEILHLTSGQEVLIPANVVHGWSNLSSGLVQVRIRFRPGLAIETYLRNTYGLHGDGRVNASGKLPYLQLAVMSAGYRDMLVFELDPRRRAMLRALAPFGRLMGYRSAYPKYQATRPQNESKADQRLAP